MDVGQKVRIQKIYEPWKKRFTRKVGVIEEIFSVYPSKKIPDGVIVKVRFQMLDRKTGKIGVSQTFSTNQIILLDKIDQTC